MRQVGEVSAALVELGRRLRNARLERNDSMAIFAQRLGVSERTVRALEQGRSTVQVGIWLNALWAVDALESLNQVLAPRESLLDQARRMHKTRRQRASRRRAAGD
jgi:transcriptional regulator with XRE-family HTH domain